MKSRYVYLVLKGADIVGAFTSLERANNFIYECFQTYKVSSSDFSLKYLELNSNLAKFYFL